MYREGAVTDRMCQKWFAKFRAGDLSLHTRIEQIEILMKNYQHGTTWEIADILEISESIKLLVKMKNVPLILWKKPYGLFGQPGTCKYLHHCLPTLLSWGLNL